jgi:thymidylate synthase (FAD)
MEAGIVEAARQSTQGGFIGWDPVEGAVDSRGQPHKGDARLLRYMYNHSHTTPFEFAGMTIEVTVPLAIQAQWIRHRTLSANQASARYGPLPDRWYLPTLERVMAGANPTDNRQASGRGAVLMEEAARHYLERLKQHCGRFARDYAFDVRAGIPLELARLGMPVNWYTHLRYTANLHNWLKWMNLRMDSHAQWEHQQYANTVAWEIVASQFPRTWALFNERFTATQAAQAGGKS